MSANSKVKGRFFLIKWEEEPPKWDVVEERKILSPNKTIGATVDVEYEDESGLAVILNIDREYI